MLQGKGTHLARIYRGSLQVQHDLDAIMSLEDVNGEDVFVQVKPQQDTLIDLSPQGIPSAHRCEMWLTDDYDLDRGYFVELKKTRVIDGSREAVEESLLSAVTTGATILRVSTGIGFRSGDQVVISGTEGSESSRLKRVGGIGTIGSVTNCNMTLYADCALVRGYAAGGVVRASAFYRVVDMPSPAGVRPYKIASLIQVAARGIVA